MSVKSARYQIIGATSPVSQNELLQPHASILFPDHMIIDATSPVQANLIIARVHKLCVCVCVHVHICVCVCVLVCVCLCDSVFLQMSPTGL